MKLNIVTIIYTNRNDTIALRKLKFMNMIKKYILLNFLMLLCQQNCNAMDDETKVQQARDEAQEKLMIETAPFIVAAGIAAKTCKFSPYGILIAMKAPHTIKELYTGATYNTQEHLVKTKYPYAQKWYDDLAKKYPEAQFEKSAFLHSHPYEDTGKNNAGADINKIYLSQNSVRNLNTSYEKKINGHSCTADEEEKMSGLECTLLHEACHIKQNDHINFQAIILGTAAGTEALYQLHRKRNPVIPTLTTNWRSRLYCATKSMPKRISVFAGMAILPAILSDNYARRSELIADEFAIQHADMNALRAGAKCFKRIHDKQQCFIANQPDNQSKKIAKDAIAEREITDVHPPLLSRVAKIEAEITRREHESKMNSSK
jgi:hypothetical protein